MIFSIQQMFSDDQAITATALSTNVIDLGVAGTPHRAAAPLNQDVGKGCGVPILVQVTEDFAGLTSLTVTIEVSQNADMSSSRVLASQTIPVAELVAGKQMSVQVIPNDADLRYLAVRYTVTGGPATDGAVTAGITMGNQTNITGA